MSRSSVNRSRPIKRRRTADEIDTIKKVMYVIIAAMEPMTVRQVFYQVSNRKHIAKTEGEYKSTIVRLLTDMRRGGQLPHRWIADNTRWVRKPRTYTGLEHLADSTARLYRRDLWNEQDVRVEIWLEKDALAGVVYEITDEYDVPLMVTKGYPSLSYLHSTAEEITECDKPTYIYYFGDHDPSGRDMEESIQREIAEHLGGPYFQWLRLAVEPDHFDRFNIIPLKPKLKDRRAAKFIKRYGPRCAEVEAIPANTLRQMVRDAIESHIPTGAWDRLKNIETEERDSWHKVMAGIGGTR